MWFASPCTGALVAVAAGGLVFGGCVSEPTWEAAGVEWFKTGATHEEFQSDKAQCEASAPAEGEELMVMGAPANDVATCLERLGYRPWAEPNIYDRARDTLPSR